MSHFLPPTTNYIPLEISDIAWNIGCSYEEAELVKAAFEIVFADAEQRRRIYEMMEELDRREREKGEPDGLRVRFAVDMDTDGYTVMRGANYLLPGEEPLGEGRVEVFCRIKGNFPTDEWLGPLVLNRPKAMANLAKEKDLGKVRTVYSAAEARKVLEEGIYWPALFEGLRRYQAPTLNERRRGPDARNRSSVVCSAAGSGVLFGISSGNSSGTIPGANFLSSYPFHTSSGASPPLLVGDHGHSVSKAVLRQ